MSPDLTPLFRPRSIAVIGASTHGPGSVVLRTLERTGFSGTIEPINPRLASIEGRLCYSSIREIEQPVDAAVVMLRADRCPQVIAECAAAGVKAAVVFATGFSEADAAGAELERRLVAAAEGRVAVLGPNCMGYLAPAYGSALYLDVVHRMPPVGEIALVVQSGSIGISGLNHNGTLRVSAMVSVGNEAMVTTPDVIRYLIQDGVSTVVAIHQEGFRASRAFLDVADEAADAGVRLVLCKTGRSAAGARAARSHTGVAASDDRVVRAVLGARGVTIVRDLDELFHAAEILAAKRRVGPRLAGATLSGGHLGLLHDLVDGTHLAFPEPGKKTRAGIEKALAEGRSHSNPLDAWSNARPVAEGFRDALLALRRDTSFDSYVIAVDAPADAPTAPVQLARDCAEAVVRAADGDSRLWTMVSTAVACDDPAVKATLAAGGIPRLNGLRAAVAALDAVVTTTRTSVSSPAAWTGSLPQTEPETYAALRKFGVHAVPHTLAVTRDEARDAARSIGYPVVAKAVRHDLLHKTDAGAVVLDIVDEQGLDAAFDRLHVLSDRVLVAQQAPPGADLYVGGRVDEQFGPVVAFGLGGVLVDLFDDVTVLAAPTDADVVEGALNGTRAGRLLAGFRAPAPLDIPAFCRAVVGVSHLVAALALPGIAVDVNPIRVWRRGAAVLDAKTELPPAGTPDTRRA